MCAECTHKSVHSESRDGLLFSSETYAKKILPSALFEGRGGGSADHYLGQGPINICSHERRMLGPLQRRTLHQTDRLIYHSPIDLEQQTDVCLVLNQSEIDKYNTI